MSKSIEVVGIDVGNGYTKTVNTEFVSAVKDYGETKPAITDNLLLFEGKYYIVGGERTKTKTDKKTDNTALILALAGLGYELNKRNIGDSSIILSEGLPLERCTRDMQIKDEEYYRQGETLYFEFEDVPHTVKIEKVLVNPQCVAGIVDLLAEKKLPDPCIVVDVGSWTIDILPIEDGKPQSSRVKSTLDGVINCMLSCNDEIRRRTGEEVSERQIQKIMMGDEFALPPEYSHICTKVTEEYVKGIADTLSENKYNVKTMTCVFMGGGASVVKKYGKKYFPISNCITNIRANAIGCEKIGNQWLKQNIDKISD